MAHPALATRMKAGWVNNPAKNSETQSSRVLNNSVRTLPHRVFKPATPLQLELKKPPG